MRKGILVLTLTIVLSSLVLFSGCVSQNTEVTTQNAQKAQNTNIQSTNIPVGNGMGKGNGFGKGNVVDSNGNINDTLMLEYIKSMPKQPLTEEEKEGLIEMREEEKLARDVYLTLYEKWKLPIFKNIAESEETHTTAVKYLLEKYNISDPVKNDSVGVFSNPKFEELYKKLVEEGNKSVVDALIVGATIEDLDIADLEKWINKTDNEDIKFVYENLMRGSRNHLRAFVRMLERYGANYTPQYISKEEFEEIINSPTERGING